MSLPIIDEETVLNSYSTTNTGLRPLGHSTVYGASSDDSTSIFSYSTNSTASNLVGPGRVLGNAYSFAGKRLERTLGDLAHKAGFSPEAIYQQISTLYLEDWKMDGKKASLLQKLCFKLFKQTKSIADSTRFMAIMRWRDILRDQHEIYVWLFCGQRERMVKHASALLRVIEELRSTINTLSDFQDAVLSETSLLIECHSMGLNFMSLSSARLVIEEGNLHVDWTSVTNFDREAAEKWDFSFQYLLQSLSDPTITKISQWYIDLWSSQFVKGKMHAQIALQCCRSLISVLKPGNSSKFDHRNALHTLCKTIHVYFVGGFGSDTLLIGEEEEFLPYNGVPIKISSTIAILNELAESHNRVFSSDLVIVPNHNYLTMLGSTDLKEKIKGALKAVESQDGYAKRFTELMLLRFGDRILKRALSELEETSTFHELYNATSFADETSRCALVQLGDILQTLPGVYMLLIVLGGDEIRARVKTICQSLKDADPAMGTRVSYPGILIKLRSLLVCHATGLRFALACVRALRKEDWNLEINQFIEQTSPCDFQDFRQARTHFVPFLIDKLTFNPSIFYLKYWMSLKTHDHHDFNIYFRTSLLSCDIAQSTLLTEESIPPENRSAIEELWRTMHNLMMEKLPGALTSYHTSTFHTSIVGHAMRSVYMDLTKAGHTTFKDEVEDYLSQLCNLLFNVFLQTSTVDAMSELASLFDFGNIFGWFLSNRGPNAEQSILRTLEDTRSIYSRARYHKPPFSYLEAHKLGVKLLAPRHEKLHFEGAGLKKRPSTSSVEPPLTPEQRQRWINAFKTLTANMSSADSNLMGISLFYFANCPLPFESDPMLDTALALGNCEILRLVFTEGQRFKPANEEDVSRAVSYIHTCLTKRVVCVQQSCIDVTRSDHTFYGTPFDIPKVVKVLNDLAKSCEEKLGADAPELLPPPDY